MTSSHRWQRGERAWCLCSPVVLRSEQPATVARGGKVPTLELDGVTHLCPTADPAPRRLGRPPAGEPLVRLSVTLPERQVAELHAESARAGVSVSALISDALDRAGAGELPGWQDQVLDQAAIGDELRKEKR